MLCTPLFLGFATTFYPEVLEAALGMASVALAMPILASGPRPHGIGRLLLAGLAGGTALVVRQTALALPLALALLALFAPRNGRLVGHLPRTVPFLWVSPGR
jgi:hypothetical protein